MSGPQRAIVPLLLPGQAQRLGCLLRGTLPPQIELVVNEAVYARQLTVFLREPNGRILAQLAYEEHQLATLGDLWADRAAADLLASLAAYQVA